LTIAVRGIALIAVTFALVFALWLSPAWEPGLDDQVQYLALAHGLADRAEYTRATAGEPFIPESLRAPGEPLILAPQCRTVGCDHWRIAVAQAALTGVTVLLVASLARRVLTARPALVATAIVALYPTFSFFAALALSETLSTVLLVLATVLLVRTSDAPTPGRAFAAGLALGALAVTRWLFLPFIVVALLALALALRRVPPRLVLSLVVGWALVLAPAIAYSYATLGRPVAGSLGTQLWLGYFEARDPATLDSVERAAADRGRERIAAFVAQTDRVAQARAFIALDDALRDEAIALIAHAPGPYLARAAQRSFELWAGDRPYPQAADGAVSLELRAGLAAAQIVLLVAGLAGVLVLAARRDPLGLIASLFVLSLWALSAPLWTEARFSLPVKPLLIVGAVWLVASRQRLSHGTRLGGSPA
jgi:4-amino-4-deoxy-L-arabinose transferase-like glycosyltransferase